MAHVRADDRPDTAGGGSGTAGGFGTILGAGAQVFFRASLLLLGCVVLAPAGALAQIPGIQMPPEMRDGACVVVRVIDGDTIDCASGERLRLLLIDAPEMEQAPHGEQARAALLTLAPVGTTTKIKLDVQERDRYGRVLGYLYLSDGRMVNEELARLGYVVASAYPPNVKHLDRIRSAVAAARQLERGLWATAAFRCKPAQHRAGRC